MTSNSDIGSYLQIIEHYTNNAAIIVEETVAPVVAPNISERLEDILFKIRAYSEPTDGDYADGFEAGLEMAAQMIENILRSGE